MLHTHIYIYIYICAVWWISWWHIDFLDLFGIFLGMTARLNSPSFQGIIMALNPRMFGSMLLYVWLYMMASFGFCFKKWTFYFGVHFMISSDYQSIEMGQKMFFQLKLCSWRLVRTFWSHIQSMVRFYFSSKLALQITKFWVMIFGYFWCLHGYSAYLHSHR